MNTLALRQKLKADASHTIHVQLPPEMGDDVEVIIFPIGVKTGVQPQASQAMARLMDSSGFAQNILNSPEEDCWNEL